MAKSKGEKAIERENARAMREKKKQIEQANKMLIPVPKATSQSMNLISFDPAGTFRFADGRWVRCYRYVENDIRKLIQLSDKFHSEMQITFELDNSENDAVLTLTLQGEIYDEVRTRFMEDEATLRGQINLIPFSVDEIMSRIAGQPGMFHYASMVRGKKDWKEECFPKLEEESSFFQMNGFYGECFFVMQFPGSCSSDLFENLTQLGCPICLSITLKGIDEMDRIDYNRALEQRYSRRLSNEEVDEYVNLSMQLMFTCDSDDARGIIEKTVIQRFSKEGFVLSPSIGVQKLSAESFFSKGLTSRKSMRNVSKSNVEGIFGKEELWQ